jgi:hypothetical protein
VRHYFSILLILFIFTLLLVACGGTKTTNSAPVVEKYLAALVAKDEAKLVSLSCGDWENNAVLELNSFQAVDASLEDVSCKETGSQGNSAFVNCSGKILASYGDENHEIDLSVRTYVMLNEGGQWLVCGEK